MLFSDLTISGLADAFDRNPNAWKVAAVEVDVDPLIFSKAGQHQSQFSGYFGRAGGIEIGAVGSAWQTSASTDAHRLKQLATTLPPLEGARFLIGYSFENVGSDAAEWDGFDSATAVLPALSIVRDERSTRLVGVAAPGTDVAEVVALAASIELPPVVQQRHSADRTIESVPAPDEWVEAVTETVAAIADGSFEKVVLARSVIVRSDISADAFELAERLRDGFPGCFTYAWRSGDVAFVGASPELLASIREDLIVSEPLAGTIRRGAGDDLDRVLGEELMASSKNRLEHRVVIEDIAHRLGLLTSELDVPATPRLRRISNVQHLSTRIEGTVYPGVGVLDVADALHPTPAVGGVPVDGAVTMIRKMESFDRGWYSGGIGWADSNGNGDIAVALRCALLRGSTAHLFAGAGIVAGSDPQSELEETRLKFRPLLSLLTEA